MSEHRVASLAAIAPGATLRAVAAGTEILLCNVAGTIYAIEDVCTHDGGPLDEGEIHGACVTCPRHGATFDVRTGAPTLPAVMPVATFAVHVRDGEVFVDL